MRYIRTEIRNQITQAAENGEAIEDIAARFRKDPATIEKVLAGIETGTLKASKRKDALPSIIPVGDKLNVLLIAIERAGVVSRVNSWLFPVGGVKLGAVDYARQA